MKSKSAPFYLCVLALFIGIVSPALFSDGMFMDGLIYANIAKNLADGMGSFWYLKFSESWFSNFHEHPPLAMALQSLFFRIFGDTMYVERFYSLTTYMITAWIMIKIWKELSDKKMSEIAWLALVLWMSIPLVTWAAANNMLENTMMIFTSLAVLFMMKSIKGNALVFTFLAGIMLNLAFLTKGFTSLFPLSLYFWLWLFNWDISFKFKHFFTRTFLLIISFLLPFLLIYLFNYEGIISLQNYFNIQVVNSLNNIQTVDNRFYILYRLLRELIPALLISVFVYVFTFRKYPVLFKKSSKISKSIMILVALGLSGVMPIIISMKQSGFYILATFPFFAMAISLFISRVVFKWYNDIDQNSKGFDRFRKLSIGLLVLAVFLAFLQTNRIGRDKQMLSDIYAIKEVVPENSMISIQADLGFNWSLYGYFHRYANISLETLQQNQNEFYLSNKVDSLPPNPNYMHVQMELNKFRLYRRK